MLNYKITINVPLILKVRDIIFFSQAKHIMEHFLGNMFCPRQKKIISRTFIIRGTLVFLCPKERERGRESEGESENKSKSKSESESAR
jgi:hypothetical protein